MATIILRKKSDKGGPYYMYTLTMTYSNRQPTSVKVHYTLTSALASSSSADYGPKVTATIYCGGKAESVTVRGHNVRWSGTTKHSVSGTMTVPVGNTTTSLNTALKVVKEGGSAGELSKTPGKDLTIPKNASYTISYNANNGTGAPKAQTKWNGTSIKLQSGIPKRANYTFVGWGTSKTATKKAYSPGQTYSANKGITLYAVWQAAQAQPIYLYVPNNDNTYNNAPTETLNGILGRSDSMYNLVSGNFPSVATTLTNIITYYDSLGADKYTGNFAGWYNAADKDTSHKIATLVSTNPKLTFTNTAQYIYMGINCEQVPDEKLSGNPIQVLSVTDFKVVRSNSQGMPDISGDYLNYTIELKPQLNYFTDTSGTLNSSYIYSAATYSLLDEGSPLDLGTGQTSKTIAASTNSSNFIINETISAEDLTGTIDHTITLEVSSLQIVGEENNDDGTITISYPTETITVHASDTLAAQSFPFYITSNHKGIALLDIPPDNPEIAQLNIGAQTSIKQGLNVDGMANFNNVLTGTTLRCTNLQHIYGGNNYAPIKFYAPAMVSKSLAAGHVYHDTTFKLPAPYKHVIGVRQINTNHQSVLQMTSFTVDGDGASGNTVRLRVHFFNRGSTAVTTTVSWEVWLSVW